MILEIKIEIKKLLEKDKLIMGNKEVLKALRNKSLKKVYYASNAKQETISDLERYSSIAGVELVKLDLSNNELGTICRKPFSISVLGIKE